MQRPKMERCKYSCEYMYCICHSISCSNLGSHEVVYAQDWMYATSWVVYSEGELYCAVCNAARASLNKVCIINFSLQWAGDQIARGIVSPANVQQEVKNRIQHAGGRVDYVNVTDAENLQDLKHFVAGQEVLVALACFFGSVRLIDNVVTVQQ